MAEATHYDTLGVEKDADPKTIKKAWRRKASKAHTDRDGGDHGQMVAVNRAYETLGDPEKRARYDRTGEDAPAPSLDSKAMDAVMQIVMAMIDQAPDHEDVVTLARRHMQRSISEFNAKRKEGERQAEKLEKKRKRLTHKGKKVERNFLDDLLAQRISQIRQGFAGVDEAISVFTRGVELLEDYAYRADDPPPPQSDSAIFRVYADQLNQGQSQSGLWAGFGK